MILRSHYERRETVPATAAPFDWYGTFTLELELVHVGSFPADSQLVVWCSTPLTTTEASNARVVEQIARSITIVPLDREPIDADRRWIIDGLRSMFPARHANDGPEAAYVVLPDGATRQVRIVPTTTSTPPRDDTDATGIAPSPTSARTPPLVPFPRHVRHAPAPDGPSAVHPPTGPDHVDRVLYSLRVVAETGHERVVADAVRSLAERLGSHAFDTSDRHGASATSARPDADVRLRIDQTLDAEAYRATVTEERIELVAGSDAGLRHGLVTLAQWTDAGLSVGSVIEDAPAFAARVVHLDLARRWHEPNVVERLIDLAAWRKLNRVHLHLTDDEAWRFPVPEYPTLATVGGTRGHGLPVGPLVASGPEPYGRAYTTEEIAVWVQRADELGVTLVPEVDVPGHCHAALAAVPELRDPDDTSGARSVQGFIDNVLVPGHPETMPFLEAVFRSLAALFPNSPWLHIGGDEVPDDAWSASPLAALYARERGLHSKREIETGFHRELTEMIRTTTGRDVAMWEEAALAGLEPSGYAVAWTSVDAGRRLAEGGHDVILAPGQAYYLDMAPDRDWDTPGATWAGTVTLATTCEFDPFLAIDPALPGQIVGVQACIWGEHIDSLEVLDRLTFPRLDAIAERGWSGAIHGGPEELALRSRALPRFTTPG